jgi:(S)-2-hydroxyglutarate dehydrogenase
LTKEDNALSYDVTIIGGGIVGLATAYTLSHRYDIRILLLEAEEQLATHQTGNNSGVIHSGLYYRPGSLKARNCVSGAEMLYRFCEQADIPFDRCGKLVVATSAVELPALEELQRRGIANGLSEVELINAEQILEIEPHVKGVAGLRVPTTGIVDFRQVAQAYAKKAMQAGTDIRTSSRLLELKRNSSDLTLRTSDESFTTGNIINCAGLQSDRVARICGVDPGVRIIPFRGEYYELIPEKRDLVRNLIYPVPDPRFPFLGVHFTRMIDGGREAGPNAVLALKREGYSRLSFSLRDTVGTISTLAFWRMATRFWRVGLGELRRSWDKEAFVRALQRLIPEIQADDLTPGGAGVRAQALDEQGRLLDDFRLVEADRMLHVLNAPSPAATASISIGGELASLAGSNFGLRERK